MADVRIPAVEQNVKIDHEHGENPIHAFCAILHRCASCMTPLVVAAAR